jgi:renin receptor
MKLLFCVSSLVALLSLSEGGELRVLYSPPSVGLPSEETSLRRSHLPPLLGQILGLTAESVEEWGGSGDLLKRPEAVALFSVSLPQELGDKLPSGKHSYTLDTDGTVDLDTLEQNLKVTYPDGDYTFLDISSEIEGTHGEELSQLTSIDPVKTKNRVLGKELDNIKTIATWLHSGKSGVKNGVPDVFSFRVNGAATLNQNSESDTLKIMSKEIENLVSVLKKVYDGNCVVILEISSPAIVLKREKRAADDALRSALNPQNPHNVYSFYSPVYTAGFNIILFSSLVLALTVVFIGIGMWFMDPGKDSIIYRMTMTRAKKD